MKEEIQGDCGAVWIDLLVGDAVAYLVVLLLDSVYLFVFSVFKHLDVRYSVAARYIRAHWIFYIVLWTCRVAIHIIAAYYLVHKTNTCEYITEDNVCISIKVCDIYLWRMVLASVIVFFFLSPTISFWFPLTFALNSMRNLKTWKKAPLQGINLREQREQKRREKYRTQEIITPNLEEMKPDPYNEMSVAVSTSVPTWLPPKIPEFELGARSSPSGDIKNNDKTIPVSQQEKYRAQFVLVVGSVDGFITGYQAQVIFGKSGIKDEDLSNLWVFADEDGDYNLSLHEYVIFAYLVDYVLVRKEFLSMADVELLRASLSI